MNVTSSTELRDERHGVALLLVDSLRRQFPQADPEQLLQLAIGEVNLRQTLWKWRPSRPMLPVTVKITRGDLGPFVE